MNKTAQPGSGRQVKQDREYLYGIHSVLNAVEQNKRKLYCLYYKIDIKNKVVQNIISLAQKKSCSVHAVSAESLSRFSQNKLHQGVVLETSELPVCRWKDWLFQQESTKPSLLIAVDQIADPQNLGAIIRTAVFLGASGMLYAGHHLSPLTATVSKTSSGGLEILPIIRESNLGHALRECKKNDFWVVGASLAEQSKPYQTIDPMDKSVLVVGNEGDGLRQKTEQICDLLVSIEGTSVIDSLNVSAATAILLAHFNKNVLHSTMV